MTADLEMDRRERREIEEYATQSTLLTYRHFHGPVYLYNLYKFVHNSLTVDRPFCYLAITLELCLRKIYLAYVHFLSNLITVEK